MEGVNSLTSTCVPSRKKIKLLKYTAWIMYIIKLRASFVASGRITSGHDFVGL